MASGEYFTCLLSGRNEKHEKNLRKNSEIWWMRQHEEGMEVILDVNPGVFERLGITYDNLSILP
ncbi:MupG family TIM beta-alpha barrel fold protein [Mediterraneibacter gnavus]|uniref:MupG family TIM beta-alpha barrel fold protein n=1 Tax=Mediterraneibacter gnavus TaxID=33038 RepID=UPI0004B90F83|nr:MupG family TIM beta-alpha barrel fold protein [Mediterraneibacter gnavus]